MTDHVPFLVYPDEEFGRVLIPAEVCEACSDFEAGNLVPASFCELAKAVRQGTAYGKCPLGCGATGGDVAQSGDLAGFVKLWPHAYHAIERLRPEYRGDGRCIGSNTYVAPLPLAAPPGGDRERLAEELNRCLPPLPDEPVTLF